MSSLVTAPPVHVTPAQVVAWHGKLVDQVASGPELPELSVYLEGGGGGRGIPENEARAAAPPTR